MTANKYVDIFCNVCGDWEHGGGTSKVTEARKYVKHKGWKTFKNTITNKLGDICPKCQKIEKVVNKAQYLIW